jgi:hypothetical protein
MVIFREYSLAVTEKMVLILANFDGGAAVL